MSTGVFQFPPLADRWQPLSGLQADSYEIRYGRLTGPSCLAGPGLWVSGNVLATSAHGLFEDPAVVEAVTGIRPALVLADTFDPLADLVDEHLDAALIDELTSAR